MAYSSSLTDAEWEILEPLLPEILPPKKSTRPLEWSYREIIDGILYRLKNGCNWADLPQDLPPYSTRAIAPKSCFHSASKPNFLGETC
jgi:transposase